MSISGGLQKAGQIFPQFWFTRERCALSTACTDSAQLF